jgi:hypothetical protein
MPVHDWTKVPAGTFHHFHTLWLTELSNALNAGVLPRGYDAMAEQVAGGPQPDVLTLEAEELEAPLESGGAAATATVLLTTQSPPQVRYAIEDEALIYALKADHPRFGMSQAIASWHLSRSSHLATRPAPPCSSSSSTSLRTPRRVVVIC